MITVYKVLNRVSNEILVKRDKYNVKQLLMALEFIVGLIERSKVLRLEEEIELAVVESNCRVLVEGLMNDQRCYGV